MSKRGVALLVVVSLITFGVFPVFGKDVPYPDVNSEHWAYESIARLHKAGLVEGFPDGTFGGERTFTRYEMAMVFDRILQRLDGRMEMLAGTGVDMDQLLDEFRYELNLIRELTTAVARATSETNEAKYMADEAASAADNAAERAYYARLAAERALAQATDAQDAATIALAAARKNPERTAVLEQIRLVDERAQQAVADAGAVAVQALAIAEQAFAASNDGLVETIEATRLAARRAQRLAADAEAAANKAQAMATRALDLGDVSATVEKAEEALATAQVAAVRAEEARSNAEQAFAGGRDAHDKADRALALSEQAVRDAGDVLIIAQRAVQRAEQADRVAHVAYDDAERALDVAMDTGVRLDNMERRLRTMPKFGAHFRARFEEAHTNGDPQADTVDPRNPAADFVYDRTDLSVHLGIRAVVEPSDDVRLEGGFTLVRDAFDDEIGHVSNVYARSASAHTRWVGYAGDLSRTGISSGFNRFTFDSRTYAGDGSLEPGKVAQPNRVGMYTHLHTGPVSARVLASKTNDESGGRPDLLWGVATGWDVTDGLNVGVSYVQKETEPGVVGLDVRGTAGGLDYDWSFAMFDPFAPAGSATESIAVDVTVGALIGDLSLGAQYQEIPQKFDAGLTDGYFGITDLGPDKDYLGANEQRRLFEMGLPVLGQQLTYRFKHLARLDGSSHTDSHVGGFSDADLFGFDVSLHGYTENGSPGPHIESAARLGVERTFEGAVPLAIQFVHAARDFGHPHWKFGTRVDRRLGKNFNIHGAISWEDRPIRRDDWTDYTAWDAVAVADAAIPGGHFDVEQRRTLVVGANFSGVDRWTVGGAFKNEEHANGTPDKLVATTVDFDLGYTFGLLRGDVALRIGMQTYELTGNVNPNIAVRERFVSSVDYVYPIADGMAFTFGGKWANQQRANYAVDNYYFSGLRASFDAAF